MDIDEINMTLCEFLLRLYCHLYKIQQFLWSTSCWVSKWVEISEWFTFW